MHTYRARNDNERKMNTKLGYFPQNKQEDKEVFIEIGLIAAIVIVLGITFLGEKHEGSVGLEPSMEEFYEHPLQAWQSTDSKGQVVRVRYAVQRENTKLYMVNTAGKVVHKQPLSLNRYKDGRDRIETYVWRLYRTEWTDNISPGSYQIIVGTTSDGYRNGLRTEINIQ